MDKLYNRTYWEDDNAPDIDADNLNNIESGIDAIDNRVIALNDGLSNLGRYTKLPLKQGYYDNGTGAFGGSNPNWVCTEDAQNIEPNKNIGFEVSGKHGGIIIIYYDSSKRYIGYDSDEKKGCYSFTTPTNCAYFNIDISGENITPDNITVKIFYGEMSEIAKVNSNLNDLRGGTGKNIIKKIVYDTALDGIGSSAQYDGWFMIDYSPVEPNTTYTSSGISSKYIDFYDSNKNHLGSENSSWTFTTPNDCYYIRANSLMDGYPTPMIEKGSIATEYEIPIKSNAQLTQENESFISLQMTTSTVGTPVRQNFPSGFTALNSIIISSMVVVDNDNIQQMDGTNFNAMFYGGQIQVSSIASAFENKTVKIVLKKF